MAVTKTQLRIVVRWSLIGFWCISLLNNVADLRISLSIVDGRKGWTILIMAVTALWRLHMVIFDIKTHTLWMDRFRNAKGNYSLKNRSFSRIMPAIRSLKTSRTFFFTYSAEFCELLCPTFCLASPPVAPRYPLLQCLGMWTFTFCSSFVHVLDSTRHVQTLTPLCSYRNVL